MTETISANGVGDNKADHAADAAQILAFDRRRAGRQDINPALVPLLRDPANGTAAIGDSYLADDAYAEFLASDPLRDQLAPARGIMLGLSISMMFWGVVGYVLFR